jgi:hypothetical protein
MRGFLFSGRCWQVKPTFPKPPALHEPARVVVASRLKEEEREMAT